MILIDYSNNETIEFKSLSDAMSYTYDLFVSEIYAVGIRSSNASVFNRLQHYIAGLNESMLETKE